MFTDTHAHLYWDSFKEDFDEMLQRALEAKVTTLINVGVDVEKSREAAEQAQNIKWPDGLRVYSTIGIHPHEAVKYSLDSGVSIREDINKIRKLYQKDTVLAVGECGLDYLFESNPDWVPPSLIPQQLKELQRKLFKAQVDLARELNLPLIVHCRDDRGSTSSPPAKTSSSPAWDEVLKMVGTHPAILHCYSGLLPTTSQVLKTPSLIVSFAATITYPKNDYLREAVKIIPLDRIVLETDCPFLPPQSKRGIRNEPANVVAIAQTVAQVKNLTLEEVAKKTTENAKQILRLRLRMTI